MSRHQAPPPSDARTAAVMRSNRRVDTGPELRVRTLLHQAGLRFRKDHAIEADGVRVRADIAFPVQRLAVFIDGCFWHQCPEHGLMPARNVEYWAAKLMRNQARDRQVDEALSRAGWTVLRFWEHEPPDSIAIAISKQLRSQGRA
jgi:DNA mismatch endonuclease (patch repair protein)